MTLDEQMDALERAIGAEILAYPSNALGQDPDALRDLTARVMLAVSKAGFAIVEKSRYDALIRATENVKFGR